MIYKFFLLLVIYHFIESSAAIQFNVLSTNLELCSSDPLTGFTRTGFCETNEYDEGTHLICATVTQKFLEYTKLKGNDLSTPRGNSFPGLKPGDNWCLCVFRWAQAKKDGIAPPVVLTATNIKSLNYLRSLNMTLKD